MRREQMKATRFACASGAALLLAACGAQSPEAPSVEPSSGTETDQTAADEAVDQASDGVLTDAEAVAAKACHDEVWLNTEPYTELPNAAVSIVPNLTFADDSYTVPWTVEWDDPAVSASGTCTVSGDEVQVVIM